MFKQVSPAIICFLLVLGTSCSSGDQGTGPGNSLPQQRTELDCGPTRKLVLVAPTQPTQKAITDSLIQGKLDNSEKSKQFYFSGTPGERLLLLAEVQSTSQHSSLQIALRSPEEQTQYLGVVQGRIQYELSIKSSGHHYLTLSKDQGNKITFQLCLVELPKPQDLHTLEKPAIHPGSIDFKGETEIFYFELSVGQTLKARIESSEFKPVAFLFEPGSAAASSARATEIEHTTRVTGQHMLKILASSDSPSATGDYQLHISKENPER